MMVLDSHAKNTTLLETYSTAFREYNNAMHLLSGLKEKEKKAKLDADYFRFQFSEISEAQLKEDEQELLEQELELLNNSEGIKTALTHAGAALNGEEQNILIAWSSVVASMQQVAKVFPKASALLERIKSMQVELKDIAGDIELMERDIVFDPERIRVISDRLDEIYRLQQKHRVNTIQELIETGRSFEKKLEEINSLDEEIATLERYLSETRQVLSGTAVRLHQERIKTIPVIEKEVTSMLGELGMKQAVFKIELETITGDKFKSSGTDSVRFLFSANKGVESRELHKIASGGELSRLMLCIKSMLAKVTGLPTIIFDEIDTGISGEVAHKVGKILREMARERQVITITHLPQMAGKGNEHLFVYKESKAGTTFTRIKKLNRDERVAEIAKMLSGDQPSRAAIANAKELLEA
jgi:DNA repair protein RecN (Recombination protein N)